jgi:hypothetical protein
MTKYAMGLVISQSSERIPYLEMIRPKIFTSAFAGPTIYTRLLIPML